jgi:hypothetical protein
MLVPVVVNPQEKQDTRISLTKKCIVCYSDLLGEYSVFILLDGLY